MRHTTILLGALLLAFSVSVAPNVLGADGVDDVIRMSRAGVSEDVLNAYVQDSKLSYDDMSAEDIQALQDNGVPSTVIVNMIDHGKDVAAAPVNTAVPDNGDPAAVDVDVSAADTVLAPESDDANITYFYQALAPDGRWQQVDDLGWCWQPRVAVQADWRPYTNDGHWVWSDAGWFFESDYRWSWAAFHYGRWQHHERVGWIWQPGTEWAPAWVSWRESDNHYGWAPLPPDSHFESGVGFTFHNKHVGLAFDFGLSDRDYTFVPSDRFLETNLAIVALPRDRNRDVFRQTTIVNNTYVYNDNRIINNGVSVRQVQQRTNRKLEAVAISDAKIRPGDAIRGEAREKNSIAVFRPKIQKAAPKDPPAAIAKNTYVKHDDKAPARTARPDRTERPVRPVNTVSAAAAKSRVAEELAKRKANPVVKKEAAAQRRDDRVEQAKEQTQNREQAREQNKDEAAKIQAERQAKLEAEKNAREQGREQNQNEAAKAQAERQAKLEAEKNTREQAREQSQNEAAKVQAERQAKLEAEKNARGQAAEQNKNEAAKAQAERQAKLEAEKNTREQAREQNQNDAAKAQAERQARVEAEKAAREAKKPEPAPKADNAPKTAAERKADAEKERADRVQEREDKREEQKAKRDEK